MRQTIARTDDVGVKGTVTEHAWRGFTRFERFRLRLGFRVDFAVLRLGDDKVNGNVRIQNPHQQAADRADKRLSSQSRAYAFRTPTVNTTPL